MLSQVVDGVVLVVRHGMSGSAAVKKVIEEIGLGKIIGIIFNGHQKNILSSALLYKRDRFSGVYHREQ